MRVLIKPPDCPARVPVADLFRQAQAGCPASLDRLMAEHDGLVQAVIRKQFLGPLSFAEALQAGRIGLWRAILGYDLQRGLAFSTYAWPCIARQVWSAVKAAHHPLPAVAPLVSAPAHTVDPVTACESSAVQSALHELVARLPDPLRTVVVAHYGLGDAPPLSFAAIGVTMGLCRERIRQLHTEALIWLRQPGHAQQVRSLLGRHTLAEYQWADAQAQTWLRQRRRRHGH
jgi:RNA polymerase sigma factor (sigma-70 family)